MNDGSLKRNEHPSLPAGHAFERVVGSYDTGRPGPLVITIGGMHGNEPGGIFAAQRVLELLRAHELPLRGRFLALAGNLRALAAGRRFVSMDLNRAWSEERVTRLDAGAAAGARHEDEDAEQHALLVALREAVHGHDGEVMLLDLHSSSAFGAPFSCMGDTLKNRRLALALPIPVILGLEEIIHGSLLEYLGDRGHVCVAVEGGRHEDPATVDHHEAVLWIALTAAGALAPTEVPELDVAARRLKDAARGRPGVVEIVHRHHVQPTDGFRMEPGYKNFEWMRRGQLLARDLHGEVRAETDGVLLLPLYQELGEDGFFLGKEVRRLWLRVSRVLRTLRAGRLLRLLPGVRRHPEREDTLLVDPQVARYLAREIFHLFGYRQCRREGDKMVFTRRREGEALEL